MDETRTENRDEGTSGHIIANQHKSASSIPSEDGVKGPDVVSVLKKRKRIHMNDAQCLSHSKTSEGAMPLTNPKPQGLSKSRNWDANTGLYPRPGKARRHWSPNKGSTIRGQGQSASRGSPMKQGRIDAFFPQSPKKMTNNNVSCQGDCLQIDPNHANSQTYDRHHEASANSSRTPRKYTQAVLESLPTNQTDGTCPQGAYFSKPQGCAKRTPKKIFSNQIQCTKTSPRALNSLGIDPPSSLNRDNKPSSKAVHTPVKKSLFPIRSTSRHSTDLVRDFEEDDSITTDMFDNAVGTLQRGKETSLRDKPGCSSSLEKDFEDDDSFTAEDFDEVFQSSQGSAKSVDKGPEKSDFEKALDEEELTTEEFDDILQSSQSPVKNAPFRPSPKKNTYGLLGDDEEDDHSTSDDIEDDIDHFTCLPDEILENILGQLPIQDMCLSAAMVCKRWHSIISREMFTPWKKRYYRMKKIQNPDYIQETAYLIADGDEIEKRACLMQLIGYMKILRVTDHSAIDHLKGHPMFSEAVQVMERRTPQVFENHEPHPWSTVATLVILSQSALEVCHILDCLLVQKEPIPRMDVSECFYFLASALFLFERKFKINRGLHYRVFHALHTLESSETGNDEEMSKTAKRSTKGQQSLFRYGQRKGISLTPEQLRIINHNLMPSDVIKIIAFAGTGKTTTLVRFAQLRPHLTFLYIAFNKTVQQQAEKQFPKNVECRTLHSLAYRAVGFKYRNKMSSMLKPYFITSLLPKLEEKVMHHMTLAKHVCTTINHFLASDDECITTAHVPTIDTSHVPQRPLDHGVRMIISNAAESVFQSLIDLNNRETKITHDVYMKLYELQHPQLEGYDCLLIDEAQDLTLAQQSILLRQRCAKILVGDPHQQIYSFRGATNAMARVQATRMYHLTQSFRFGPQIAYVANCLLEVLKGHTKSTIIGAGPQGRVDGGRVGQVATICRSNATLFTEAVKMVRSDENVKIEFSGGVEGYGFDKILDLYYLSLPQEQRGSYRIKDKFISRFKSVDKIRAYAKGVDDMELQSRLKLVFTYHSQIPSLIEKIKRSAVRLNGAYVLTTAHKAKGLEYDTVTLTDDFLCNPDPLQQIIVGTQTLEDEKNILYVAVTRAKKSLVLNRALKDYLQKVKEKFEHPVLAKKLKEEKGPQRCQECGEVQDDDKQLLLLERKHIKLTHPVRTMSIEGGIVCPNCVEAPGLEELYGKPPPTEEEIRAMEMAEMAEEGGIFIFI